MFIELFAQVSEGIHGVLFTAVGTDFVRIKQFIGASFVHIKEERSTAVVSYRQYY